MFLKRVFAMTNVFSWENSVSLCPASFCTPRQNLPVTPSISAGVQPRWIQGDSKVGRRSRRLWKNTYLITDIERLEMDSVVGRLVEKKRLNSLDYVE